VERSNSPGPGCSVYADPPRTAGATTCRSAVQDAARLPPAGSFDRPPQRGGEEPEKDAEASDEEKGELVDTTPGPEEPAGRRPGLQESSGTHSGSSGGRETRSKTCALLRIAEKEMAKSKTQEELPKGFEELPRTDPDYQGVQGFSFGDFHHWEERVVLKLPRM
jgi:hypothetical protein